MTGPHDCPAPGCDVKIPYSRLACKRHWYAIPATMRNAIWIAYRGPGPGSDEHTAAITAAIDWLRANR